MSTTKAKLFTSLAEIRSFSPCKDSWKNILLARPHNTEEEMSAKFPLVECLESNTIEDVCWLLGKRQNEIQICVKFARMCADSVKEEKNISAEASSSYADYANYVADIPSYDTAAAAAASSSIASAFAAAAASSASSYSTQISKNKEFLIQCILDYEKEMQ